MTGHEYTRTWLYDELIDVGHPLCIVQCMFIIRRGNVGASDINDNGVRGDD